MALPQPNEVIFFQPTELELLQIEHEGLLSIKKQLRGPKNKKKRAALNKKIVKVEERLKKQENIRDKIDVLVHLPWEPEVPEDWLISQHPSFKRYQDKLQGITASELRELAEGLRLQHEFGIKNGGHRKKIKMGINKLCLELNWNHPLPAGFIKQTIRKGDETQIIKKGDHISLNYTGTLRSDPLFVFDSNLRREAPFSFHAGTGQCIRGFDEGLLGCAKGEKIRLTIRSDYAYGKKAQEKIPANSDLIFEVEILNINSSNKIQMGNPEDVFEQVKQIKAEQIQEMLAEQARKQAEAHAAQAAEEVKKTVAEFNTEIEKVTDAMEAVDINTKEDIRIIPEEDFVPIIPIIDESNEIPILVETEVAQTEI